MPPRAHTHAPSRSVDSLDAALLARFPASLELEIAPRALTSSLPPSRTPSPAPKPAPTTTPFSLLSEVFPRHAARDIRRALTEAGGDASVAAAVLAGNGGGGSGGGSGGASAGRAAAVGGNGGGRRRGKGAKVGLEVGLVNRRRPGAGPVLGGSVRRHVAGQLREVVVPALRAQFEEVVFGDYEEKGEGYAFCLKDVAVGGLAISDDCVLVGAVAGGWRVHVVNGFLELDVGEWRYRSNRLFGFDDGGGARVVVHGLSAAAMLMPRSCAGAPGGLCIDVTDVEVTFEGAFRVRTFGTSADWVYNAAAAVLKPLTASYVKTVIADSITTALKSQLSGWADWAPAAQPPLSISPYSSPHARAHQKRPRYPCDRAAPGERAAAAGSSPVSSDEAPESPPAPAMPGPASAGAASSSAPLPRSLGAPRLGAGSRGADVGSR